MHMRKKHFEGTKQDMERDRGIRVRDTLLYTTNCEDDSLWVAFWGTVTFLVY